MQTPRRGGIVTPEGYGTPQAGGACWRYRSYSGNAAGEPHERIKSTVDRHTERLQRHHAEQTAKRPILPCITVTPYQETHEWYGDYTDRRQGAGGADRQE